VVGVWCGLKTSGAQFSFFIPNAVSAGDPHEPCWQTPAPLHTKTRKHEKRSTTEHPVPNDTHIIPTSVANAAGKEGVEVKTAERNKRRVGWVCECSAVDDK